MPPPYAHTHAPTPLHTPRHINLSLHYLEQVIVALQERSAGITRRAPQAPAVRLCPAAKHACSAAMPRTSKPLCRRLTLHSPTFHHTQPAATRAHVPYRNSLMTMVLRDSLGGNCRTVMVATISTEQEQARARRRRRYAQLHFAPGATSWTPAPAASCLQLLTRTRLLNTPPPAPRSLTSPSARAALRSASRWCPTRQSSTRRRTPPRSSARCGSRRARGAAAPLCVNT